MNEWHMFRITISPGHWRVLHDKKWRCINRVCSLLKCPFKFVLYFVRRSLSFHLTVLEQICVIENIIGFRHYKRDTHAIFSCNVITSSLQSQLRKSVHYDRSNRCTNHAPLISDFRHFIVISNPINSKLRQMFFSTDIHFIRVYAFHQLRIAWY